MPSGNNRTTIWVTGGNGQLASEIKKIASDYPSYQFLFTTKEALPIEDTVAVEQFFNRKPIGYLINCAAYTAVDKAESEKEKAFLINAESPGKLAECCRRHHTKFIHISTDYVYDGSKAVPLKEDFPVAPLNIYGLSKLKGEEAALGIDPSVLIIRTSWVYSSFGNNFVKTMLRLFKEKDEIGVVADQLGSPTYAADLAAVILQLIDHMEKGEHLQGIVNYCNAGTTTWYEFAETIKRLTKSTCKINPISTSSFKTAAKRPSYSVLDTSKIKKYLHSEIPFWETSLSKCLQLLNSDKP